MTDERFLDLAVRALLDGLDEVEAVEFEAALAQRGADGEATLRRLRETLGLLAEASSSGPIPAPINEISPSPSDATSESPSATNAASAREPQGPDRVLPHAMEPPDRLRDAILGAIETAPQLPPLRAYAPTGESVGHDHDDATVTVVAEVADDIPERFQKVEGEEHAEVSSPSEPLNGWKRVNSNKGFWMPLAAGVSLKVLHVNKPSKMATVLIRMKPGSQFPSHKHAGNEECFIVDGTLKMNGWELGPGDYVHGDQGSTHVDMVTESGATVLVVTSIMNEWI